MSLYDDYMDDPFIWEDDYYDEAQVKKVTCKYCGKSDLYWFQTTVGWKLLDCSTQTLHKCDKYAKNSDY